MRTSLQKSLVLLAFLLLATLGWATGEEKEADEAPSAPAVQGNAVTRSASIASFSADRARNTTDPWIEQIRRVLAQVFPAPQVSHH